MLDKRIIEDGDFIYGQYFLEFESEYIELFF